MNQEPFLTSKPAQAITMEVQANFRTYVSLKKYLKMCCVT